MVDFSGNTNPPVIQLDWPQNGTHIGADSFTCRGWLGDPSAQIWAQLVDTNGVTNIMSGRVGRDGAFRIPSLPLSAATNAVTLIASNVLGQYSATNIAVIRSSVTITIDASSPISPSVGFLGGEISEPGYTIWVNGVMADQDEWGWVVWESPLTVDSTFLQIRAIPNSDNGGNGSSGAAFASEEVGNPDSNDAVDIEVEVDPAGQQYNRSYFVSDHTVTGYPLQLNTICPHEWDTTVSWEEEKGGGGIHTWRWAGNSPVPCEPDGWPSATYTWPGGRYPNLPSGTVLWTDSGLTNEELAPCGGPYWEESDRNYASPWGNLIEQRKAQAEFVLETGGPASSTEKSLWMFTAGTGGNLPQEISIGGLGNLDTNGMLFAMLADRTQVSDTPTANPKKPDTGNVWVYGVKYTLVSTCVATTPADRARTNIGVGEEVNLTFTPPLVTNAFWAVSAGSKFPAFANHTRLTAPSNAATVTVTVNVGQATLKRSFNVIEPTKLDHADFVEYYSYTSTTKAGAGVHLRPYIGPTNVSFYKVQIEEVGENASDVIGYFTVHSPPSHIGNGADAWISLDYDNHWLGDYDWARSNDWPSPWSSTNFSGGSYTWNIPSKWRVKGLTNEHSMTGWNQVHTLSSNGTMSVSKFGHTVSRTIQNVYSGN